MSHTTRFLTGSLASLAVASGVGLAAPAAYADLPARPCGQPAVAPVFATVVHEPELRHVPAVTHDEWRWERQVTTFLHEYSTVVTPAYTVNDWARTLPVITEFEWSHKVVTQEARPAVPSVQEAGQWEVVETATPGSPTEFEYVQQQTGRTRWEADGWNGEVSGVDHGQGWVRTGQVRQWVVTQEATNGSEAVPEVSHLEYTWGTTSPGADWTRTDATPRTSGGGTETTTTHDDGVPSGAGWSKTASHVVDAVVDTLWAHDAPDGYTATDAAPQPEVSTESTEGTSPTSPEGDGWSKVAGSLVTIVDQDAATQLVGGGTEQVLVTAGLPATDACAEVKVGTSHVAAPTAGGSTASGSSATVAAPADAGTVLPATGSPISPLLLTTGLGALLTGGALVRVGRRRRTS